MKQRRKKYTTGGQQLATTAATAATSMIPGAGPFLAPFVGAGMGHFFGQQNKQEAPAMRMTSSYAKGGKRKYAKGGYPGTSFTGPTHEGGGIPLTSDMEVEGGESMMMKGGTPYIFSNRVRVPGSALTFAAAHKKLMAKGGSAKAMDTLSLMQEKVTGRMNSSAGQPQMSYAYGGVAAPNSLSRYSQEYALGGEPLRLTTNRRIAPLDRQLTPGRQLVPYGQNMGPIPPSRQLTPGRQMVHQPRSWLSHVKGNVARVSKTPLGRVGMGRAGKFLRLVGTAATIGGIGYSVIDGTKDYLTDKPQKSAIQEAVKNDPSLLLQENSQEQGPSISNEQSDYDRFYSGMGQGPYDTTPQRSRVSSHAGVQAPAAPPPVDYSSMPSIGNVSAEQSRAGIPKVRNQPLVTNQSLQQNTEVSSDAVGGNRSDFLAKAATYGPDIANALFGAFAKDKTRPATRVNQRAVGMMPTTYNIAPQREAASASYRALLQDPGVTPNMALAGHASNLKHTAELYGQKNNMEAQMQSQQAQMQGQLDVTQAQYSEGYRQDKMMSDANRGITGNIARQSLSNLSTRHLQNRMVDTTSTVGLMAQMNSLSSPLERSNLAKSFITAKNLSPTMKALLQSYIIN